MNNAGFVILGTSRETSAFVCDAIALAWQEDRAEHYPHAQEILLTLDAGSANAARSRRFKEDPVPLSPAGWGCVCGWPTTRLHLQLASDRAPFVLSCRASLKRCHP